MVRRRSTLAAALAIVGLLLGSVVGAAAQEATPAAFADTMGLPELRVRVTDASFEGLPAEVPAGRYLLTVESATAEGGTVAFMQLPEGMGVDDFVALLSGPTPASPEPGVATPTSEVGPPASPAAAGEEGPPEWYYQTKMAGGTGAFPGQTAQAIVDLTPGEWIAWADDPEAPQAPVGLTVTGEAGATPEAAEEPAADVTVTMFEYDFTVAGAFAPGPQTIKVANVGAQPHFMLLQRSPGPITEEQIQQLLDLAMTGGTPAPDADLPNPDEFVPAAIMEIMSSGTTAWLAANLEPGYYILICFVPDIESGIPHAFEGMYEVVAVGVDEATPTA